MASSSPPPPHIIVFPLMTYSHTLPLLDLSKTLSDRGLKVTIITTPLNTVTVQTHIQIHPNIHLKELHHPSLQPQSHQNLMISSPTMLVSFLNSTKILQQPFEQVLLEMYQSDQSLPICVISDSFLAWTLETCSKYSVPRLAFNGTGVLSTLICSAVWKHAPHLNVTSDTEPLQVPRVNTPFSLTRSGLPDNLRFTTRSDPISVLISEIEESQNASWGMIINSFVELEGEHVEDLESYLKDGAKAWCVGPLLLHDAQRTKESTMQVNWLNRQRDQSVLYVSFGTQTSVPDKQLDEIALGLEMSGHPFLWVVRSDTWFPPKNINQECGLILNDWVDQRSILEHHATGGFLSHCGWNSLMESLSMGVPLLAWPMGAEQPFNAKMVVEGLEVGLWVQDEATCMTEKPMVGRKIISDKVKELMGSQKGEMVREKANELGVLARKAINQNGSSNERLNELINCLIQFKLNTQEEKLRVDLY